MSYLSVPAFHDVSGLLKIISSTGALVNIPFCSGSLMKPRLRLFLHLSQNCMCTCIFFLLAAMTVFEFVQFGKVIWDMDSIGEVIPNIIWITSFPLALASQIFYTFNRNSLLCFFERWQEIHCQYEIGRDYLERGTSWSNMFTFYFMAIIASVTLIIVVILDFPIMPFLPNLPVQDANKIFTCALFATSLFYAWTLAAASDLVPTIIYSHLAHSLEIVADMLPAGNKHGKQSPEEHVQMETTLTSTVTSQDAHWQKTWAYYEAVRELISRANDLFGAILVINHGAMFFVASSMIFAILRWFNRLSWLVLLVHGLNGVQTLLRLVTNIIVCSRLSAVGIKIESQLSRIVSNNWFQLDCNERQFFTLFLIRVQDKGTTASPLGLYYITNSKILTLASLLVTYMIVLLQSTNATIWQNYANYTGHVTGTRFYRP